MQAQPRIYADTSVIGGCLDPEFAEDSLRLIEQVHGRKVILLLSEIVVRELVDAPPAVRAVLEELPLDQLENVVIDAEVEFLRDAYLDVGIVSPRWRDDATHVAAASVAGAEAIVSWNFRHIVRLDLMRGYNEVNAVRGYRYLSIITPVEVARESIGQDDEDV